MFSQWVNRLRALGRSDLAGLSPRRFARWAEDRACRHLESHGCRVVARNFRADRGEVDIIAADGDAVVFVEVKAVRTEGAEPEFKVDGEKRRRVSAAARAFVSRHNLHGRPARFDVVVIKPAPSGELVVEHLTNAFSVP